MHSRTFLYIGCYTNDSPVGIHIFGADAGPLIEIGEWSGIDHPSFIAAHPSGAFLYAVSEMSNGNGDGGSVVVLAIGQSDGSLTVMQDVPSGGDGPCHLSVDAGGNNLCVANYVSGSVTGYRLDPNGRIGDLMFRSRHEGSGPAPRQEGPHAHGAAPHPRRTGFVVADLGIDRLLHYSFDGVVFDELQLASGSGPRHLAWHPHLPFGFVVGELDNTITVIECDERTGRLSSHATVSTLPQSFDGTSLAAEVRINREGTWVYVSNRGHDSIASFRFSDRTLELAAIVPSGGRGPRNFALHPGDDTVVVANQNSNTVNRLAVDPDTGTMSLLEEAHEVAEPVCVTFVEVSP